MSARTAVDRVGVGKKRDVNARFMAMTSHYVFEPDLCNPAAGWGEPLWRHWFKPNGERAGRKERPRCASCWKRASGTANVAGDAHLP